MTPLSPFTYNTTTTTTTTTTITTTNKTIQLTKTNTITTTHTTIKTIIPTNKIGKLKSTPLYTPPTPKRPYLRGCHGEDPRDGALPRGHPVVGVVAIPGTELSVLHRDD
ncbi:hypothetical protein E2C01_098915 [Portunus trituberculatus]|uniref:Uncharacterized protein n=1 Tax=Portunus trituberculatus TaxID=210409 RepID=A0A5B7K8X8_PORTR|nr:hypothetical protein [Portunus trituberculatus]